MLNEYQQALIDAIQDNQIIIGEACPGSGKTRTMEEAVSTLLKNGVDPARIGVFTFSRKSAAEARRRIARTAIPDISKEELDALENGDDYEPGDPFADLDPIREMIRNWICTIHAMSFRILKASGYDVRVPSGKETWPIQAIVKDGIKELDWDEAPKSVWRWIAIAINNLASPYDGYRFYQDCGLSHHQASNMATLYERYSKHMFAHRLVDFDMMQANLVKLIRSKQINIGNMFDYVFVDEAQDNNSLQNEIIKALTVEAHLIMIGDVDQSIYAFRGSQPEVMRQFKNAKHLNLPINYRSTQAIVKSSASLIKHSYLGWRKADKENFEDTYFLKPFQWRDDAPEGQPISFTETGTFDDLISEIIALIGDNTQDMAILSRTRAECAAIHTGLVAAGISAINHSGGLLFGSPHIRKVLAYAHLACNYNDARNNLEILSEIANVASSSFKAPMTRRRHSNNCYAKPWEDCGCPVILHEGIDYSHARYYGQKAIEAAGSWQGIVNQQYETNRGGYPSLNAKGAADLVGFVDCIPVSNARDGLAYIIDNCVSPWLATEDGLSEDDLSENGKAEDFQLLLDMTEPEMTLGDFLDKIEWLSKQSTTASGNAVNIGTIHWSKGAEFKRVIVNLTRCPLVPPPSDPNKLPAGRPPTIEEERRLAFVAVTRAKDQCDVVQSLEWMGKSIEVSRFIEELKR